MNKTQLPVMRVGGFVSVVHGNEIHAIRFCYPYLPVGPLFDMETPQEGCFVDISLDITGPRISSVSFENRYTTSNLLRTFVQEGNMK